MKKEITYYEYFCDRCQTKTSNLYGPNDMDLHVPLDQISQSQNEEVDILVSYYLDQNSGRKVKGGSICKRCLINILQKSIEQLERGGEKENE